MTELQRKVKVLKDNMLRKKKAQLSKVLRSSEVSTEIQTESLIASSLNEVEKNRRTKIFKSRFAEDTISNEEGIESADEPYGLYNTQPIAEQPIYTQTCTPPDSYIKAKKLSLQSNTKLLESKPKTSDFKPLHSQRVSGGCIKELQTNTIMNKQPIINDLICVSDVKWTGTRMQTFERPYQQNAE